jgi:hypothetical protein
MLLNTFLEPENNRANRLRERKGFDNLTVAPVSSKASETKVEKNTCQAENGSVN